MSHGEKERTENY